jgi:hypothetical protein
VYLNEKLGYLGYPFAGYTMVVFNRGFLLAALAVVQIVAFVVLLCPLVAAYMFGLFISSGIAVWRLIEHDYGSNDREHGNMKPALDVLYSLALLQNAIFCFKLLLGLAKGFIVNKVLKSRDFTDQCRDGILDYLQQTMIICEKDPSCSRGRNLITYAVDLMESKSPDDYLSGLRILDEFASYLAEIIERDWQEENSINFNSYLFMKQEHILMKHLIVPGYSSDILQKLLQTLGYRSIYDRETKKRAARIVASIAEDIRLEELPGGIRYISSLIDTLEEYHLLQPYQRDWVNESYEQDWMEVAFTNKYRAYEEDYKKEENDIDPQNTYKELMQQGFLILGKLATNVDNSRVMVDTPYLLSKIMAPVTSDLLHHIDHGAWSSIVEGSLKVMAQLTAATGQIGSKLRSEISSSKEGIRTMMRILECPSDECRRLQKHVIWILRHLYMDTSLSLETASRKKFTERLVKIMTDDKEATHAREVTEANQDMEIKRVEIANKGKEATRATAANTLVALSSKFETTATVIIKANDNAIDHITTMIFQKHKCRLTAAQILEYLCLHYTNNDEILSKLQKAMIEAVPKVIGATLCFILLNTNNNNNCLVPVFSVSSFGSPCTFFLYF